MADKGLYNLLIDLRANVANLQSDMDKAVGILDRSTGKMQTVMKGFFLGIGASIGHELISNIGRLGSALSGLADKGEEVGSIAENFKKLGGSTASIDQARKAVLGTVSAFDLMKVANEGIARGIPNLNKNFALLSEYAGRFADATGRDTLQVLEQLTTAISTGSNKALMEFGIQVDSSGTKAEKMSQAIAQLGTNMGNFAPLTDSVSNAHKAFSLSLEDAVKQIGMGINESEGLTKAYRDLGDIVSKVDWQSVGQAIGEVAGQVATLTGKILEAVGPIATFVNNLSGAVKMMDVGMLQIDKTMLELKRKAVGVESLSVIVSNAVGVDLPGAAGARQRQGADLAEIDAQLKDINGKIGSRMLDGLLGALENGVKDSFPTSSSGRGGFTPTATFGGGGGSSVDKKHDKEKKAQEKLDGIIQNALEDRLAYETKTREKMEDILADKRKQQVGEWGNAFQEIFSSKLLGLDPQFASAAESFAAQLSAGLFTDLKKNQGGFFGLGQTIASGLGDGIAYLFGGQTSLTTRQAHDAGIQGPGMQDGSFGMVQTGSFLGAGMTTQQAHQSGIQGPGQADGSFGGAESGTSAAGYAGWAQAGMTAIDATASAKSVDKQNKDNSGTGAAIGAVAGAIIAGVLTFGLAAPLGAAIGKYLGGMAGGLLPWGAQNKDTLARHGISNFIEDGLAKQGGLTIYDQQGKNPSKLTNFVEGSTSRFNDPNWSNSLLQQTSEVQSAFSGLGEGLRAVLGVTEDVGGEMALLLGENLKFNVDNARRLVKRLGLSFEEVRDALVEVGLRGEKTWVEITGQIAGVADAFKPGLVAVGAFGQAMGNLLGSGARGFEAVQAVRDIAVEAAEAGIENFAALRQELLKTFDPKTVDAFFAAIQQQGVTSIGQLMELGDQQAGAIVGHMQSLGVKFTDTGKHMADGLSANTSSTDENTAALRENTRAQGGSVSAPSAEELDVAADGEVAAARGGVFHGPTRALMGENGPEAILPLTRRNGKLGVAMFGGMTGTGGGGYVINIDARGAAPGVGQEIRSAIRASEKRLMAATSRSVRNRDRRLT